jgi:hypothetical protein
MIHSINIQNCLVFDERRDWCISVTTIGKKSLRLVEIQESVLPEDEWILGICVLDYFNGVGYSMPRDMKVDWSHEQETGILSGSSLSSEAITRSNLDDPLKIVQVEKGDEDRLLSGSYKHADDSLQASSGAEQKGPYIEHSNISKPFEKAADNNKSMNLYAFLPGIFYCSGQQTSVDAVLIEVTQTQKFGMTLSSFRPEDVRPLDVSKGFIFDENKGKKSVQVTVDTLGSFHFEDFLKDSGMPIDDMSYSKEVVLAHHLSTVFSFSELKKAYASSSFLRSRLMSLLDDINFFGLALRHRIYVRDEKHPYGRVVEVDYRGFDCVVNLGIESGISCPDETDFEHQVNDLVFTKLMGMGIETNVEVAIMEMFHLIETGLKKKVTPTDVLSTLSQEGS